MHYRKEIDGLRALAVLPVMLFHADLGPFRGGFVGVDVFFVISGYLITSILLNDLDVGKFSIMNFYERRARRILPALFFVMLACLPAAWLWLSPTDMKAFAQSVAAVSLFSSNLLFWQTDGYFDTANALKPLLHTWSLAVEEQYYLLFPLLLALGWRLGKRWCTVLLLALCLLSLGAACFGPAAQSAGFYLLPTRAWELLIGSMVALYARSPRQLVLSPLLTQLAALEGLALILYAMLMFDTSTPFPSLYTLAPTVGTALLILFATPATIAGKLLGNRALVGIGLISYSAYLWHQPVFAFARHYSPTVPGPQAFALLVVMSLVLAWLTWKYIEAPFRQGARFSRRHVFLYGAAASMLFVSLGVAGHVTNGFSDRYQLASLPQRPINMPCDWEDPAPEGAGVVAGCLGARGNGKPGDVFLLGDSHASQLTHALRALTAARGQQLYFINTARVTDFPHAFWREQPVQSDRLLEQVLKAADKGDVLVVAFHRGRLNARRDAHIPLQEPVAMNAPSLNFMRNMENYLPKLVAAGVRVYLVKDAPLLSEASNLEKCAFFNSKTSSNFCSVSLEQDLHTRWRQSSVFDTLAARYPGQVVALDPLPTLYRGQVVFNPIAADGSYRMFDRHHLSKQGSLELLPYFESAIPK